VIDHLMNNGQRGNVTNVKITPWRNQI